MWNLVELVELCYQYLLVGLVKNSGFRCGFLVFVCSDACLLRTGAQVAPAHAAYWRGHCGARSIAWLCSLLIRTELDIGFQTDTEARVACGQSTWSCKWLALKGSESFKVRRRWLTVASSTLRIELLLNAETGWNCWRWVSSGCLLNAC